MAMRLIVVIDGDQDFLREIGRDLGGLRHRVLAVGSARRGVELARTGNPDLIVLDMDIAGSSGPAVMAELRADEITRDVPVIMTLQTADRDKLVAARKAGAVDFLLKPYKREVLLEKLDQLWRSARSREQQERARAQAGAAPSVRITRSGNRVAVILPGDLQPAYLEAFLNQRQSGALRVSEGGELIVDLRPLADLNPVSRRVLFQLLDTLVPEKPIVVAGRHYGVLLQEGYDEKALLFLSLDELLAYIKFAARA